MHRFFTLVVPVAATFALSLLLTRLVIFLARKRGLTLKPSADRWHKIPTPIFGGISIFLAFMAAIFFFLPDLVWDPRFVGLLLGGVIMFAVGLKDDLSPIRPNVKLMFQIFAAVALLTGGVYFKMFNPFFMIPLTVFWMIGITNAFNLLDNMDGLSAGIAAIVCINLFFFNFLGGAAGNAFLPPLLLLAAAAGFLVYNIKPAKIFMGDSGALFLGFTVAGLAVMGANKEASNTGYAILLPLMIMAVPIFDTTLVTVLRGLAGRKVSQGGKDHVSHRLVLLGLSEQKTVLLLYALTFLFGFLAISLNHLSFLATMVVGVLLALLLYYFGHFLSEAQVYQRGSSLVMRRARFLPRWFFTKAIGTRLPSTEVFIDFLLIGLALFIGYLLKFDGNIPKDEMAMMMFSLPILVLVKIGCLYFFGAYKPMWRYFSFRDLTNIGKAATLGSLLSVIAILFLRRFDGFSRTVYVIDWITFLALVSASRMIIRMMRESFLPLQSQGAEIVVYGAGDAGSQLLHEIYNNGNIPYRPAAFFDDNLAKSGRAIQGVPVIGGINRMKDYVTKRKIDKLVIAVPSATDGELEHVYQVGQELGMEILRFVPAQISVLENRRTAGASSPFFTKLASVAPGKPTIIHSGRSISNESFDHGGRRIHWQPSGRKASGARRPR